MPARSNPSSDTEFSAGERRTLLMGRAGEMRVLEDALAAAQKTRACRTVTVLGAAGVGKTRLVREFLSRVGATSTPARPARIFRTSAKGESDTSGAFGRLFLARFGLGPGADPDAVRAHVCAELTAVLGDRKIGDFAHCLGRFLGVEFPDSPLIRAVAESPQQLKMLRRSVVRYFWEADATLVRGVVPHAPASGVAPHAPAFGAAPRVPVGAVASPSSAGAVGSPSSAGAVASPSSAGGVAAPSSAGVVGATGEGAKPARPLILVFEDMHAATDESIELLAMLIDQLCAPIVLICVARPDLIVRREDWMAQGEGRHTQLDLLPLGESDAAAFMHELLAPCGDDPATDDLVDAAVTLAGGNPALLEQVVHVFRDTGVLEPATDDGPTGAERWIIRTEMLESVNIPLTVEDAVQARIAGLTPAERALLERAATMGGLFWFGGLLAIHRQEGPVPEIWSAATGDDGGQIRTLLADLVEKDYLLKLPDSTFPGDEEYVFKHNLEREALVRLTSSRARERYHGVIADWLAFKENITSNEDSLAMLAMHREKSGARVPTVRAYFLAAEVARAHHANTRANEYYQRGFAHIREGAALELNARLAALHDHGDILQSLGRHEEARAAFREMLERAFRLDVRAKGGAAHARIGRLCRDTGRLDEAEQHLRAALALFDQTADDRGVASTTDDLGKLYWLRGDYGKALEFGERGLAMRRAIGDQRSIALSLNNLGLVYQDSGQFKKALDSFEQALVIRRAIGDKAGIAQSLNNLGIRRAGLPRGRPRAPALHRGLRAGQGDG